MDDKSSFPIYRAAVSGLLAMLVWVGIARFGYGPLVPALVGAHWYSAAAAFWLGAINLLGYFFGAALMRFWRGLLPAKAADRRADGGDRFVAAGLGTELGHGLVRLLAAALRRHRRRADGADGRRRGRPRAAGTRKGQVGGITFAGMGAGITLSSLLIPLLVKQGLVFTWTVLGLVAVAATLVVAWLMPDATITASPPKRGEAKMNRAVLLLVIAYAGSALGFVPHMLFLSSFVAIGLQRGVAAGADVSAWLGVAAALGPVILGRVADRFGFLPTLALGYAVMAAAVALLLVNDSSFALDLSAIGVGAVALGGGDAGGRRHCRAGAAEPSGRRLGVATMAYAVMQALTAAGFSHLFHATDSFLLLFGIGAVALVGSAALGDRRCPGVRGRKVAAF